MPHIIRTDDTGSFFEDHTLGSCDFCERIDDVEDGSLLDDGRFMCFDCFRILWDAENDAVNAHMRRHRIAFMAMETNVDRLFEAHGHLLTGESAIRESIALQEQDAREQELIRSWREED